MVVIQEEFMLLVNHMVFLNKHVKLILLKILLNSVAQIFKNV